MITVCHPVDEIEKMLIVAELEIAEIPYFINGQHFGSLYPGMQVPWYNERAIRVPAPYFNDAHEIINNFRLFYEIQSSDLTIKSRIRVLFEVLLFGWVLPYGKKKTSKK